MRSGWILLLPLVVVLGACTPTGFGLSPEQAAQHLGETARVCGVIASSHYAKDSEGQPTFINLGKPFPHQIFTVVVLGKTRSHFNVPPKNWRGRLCVNGQIKSYQGEPEITVTKPAQVSH